MPHTIDENGDKIEYNVSYEDTEKWYIHKEPYDYILTTMVTLIPRTDTL